MKLFKRRKINNKGLSLVELVCAVAIFGLATTAIGSAMVVSAQSYSRGTYELDVQQEAQTTTNLIGDLLYDATGAKFSSTGDPVLTIEGEGVKYVITYKKSEEKLVYEEYRSGVETPATGTLAENVKSFSTTDLDAAGNNFKTDKNVEITLVVEKNGRNYEAVYSTTARNGAVEAPGVEDTAAIIMEDRIVLEPNQSYSIPYEVIGSISNKSVYIDNADSDLTVTQSDGNIIVKAAFDASGTLSFAVKTNEFMKDAEGNVTSNPMATKVVYVNIRRVNSITSPMDADNDGYADGNFWKNNVVGKTNYQAGTEYRIDFTVGADNANKQFGKLFDMDYVNPKQVDISLSMNGGNLNDYVESVQKNLTDNPYITFKLKEDMPSGAEFVIVVTANHPKTTNKSGQRYGIPSNINGDVQDIVRIKNEATLIWPSSDLSRGLDGLKVLMDGPEVNRLMTLYNATSFRKEYTVYEVTAYNEDGSVKTLSGAKFTAPMVDSGSDTLIRPEESKRLKPDLDYMIEMKIIFETPSGEKVHSAMYPLDKVTVLFDKQEQAVEEGTEDEPFVLVIGSQDTTVWMDIQGLAMSKYGRDYVKFVVEKQNAEGTGYEPFIDSNTEFDIQGLDSDPSECEHHIQLKMKIGDQNLRDTYLKKNEETGGYDSQMYRIKVILDDIPYNNYDGTAATPGDFNLFNESTDVGIFYIELKNNQ